MSRPWSSNTLAERCRVVVDNAEFLADEAVDAGLVGDGDHLRVGSARLAQMLEDADAKDDEAKRVAVERGRATALLRRASHRLNLEIETRLPYDEAIELSTAASLALEPSTRFRLERLSDRQRALLHDVVGETTAALRAYDDGQRATFGAYAAAHAARGRAVAVAHDLRSDCERTKARLLTVLDVDGDGYKRVSRRVIRTRRPDSWFARGLRGR